MARRVEHGLDRAAFDDAAGVHDGNAVADLGDEVEVVADEQDGDAELAADAVEHRHHLGLDGDVECGGGLVGDEQLGVRADGECGHDALAHAAAELVGVGAGALGGVGDADEVQQLHHAGFGGAAADLLVGTDAVVDLAADGDGGVEGGQGVLEDHADVAAAEAVQGGLAQTGEVRAVEQDSAAADAGAGGKEGHDGQRREALAGAAFADEADDLAWGDAEVYAADHVRPGASCAEGDVEAVDLEEGRHVARAAVAWRGSIRSRRPSPSRLKPTTEREMAAPGKTDIHHSPESR